MTMDNFKKSSFEVMKWFIVFITLTLMACGNNTQEKVGNQTIEEISKTDSIEIVDSSIKRIVSAEVKPSTIGAEDSAFISQELAELNSEYYSERNDDYGGWNEGEVVYSDDSLFKAYSFIGEFAGAYGSPMYRSIYRINNITIIDTAFLPAKEIIKLPYNQYLVLAKGPIRMRGPEWSFFEEAYFISENKIEKICQSQLSHWIENSSGNPVFYPNKADEIDSLESRITFTLNRKLLKSVTYGYDEESSPTDSLACYKVTSLYSYNLMEFNLEKSDSIFDTRLFH